MKNETLQDRLAKIRRARLGQRPHAGKQTETVPYDPADYDRMRFSSAPVTPELIKRPISVQHCEHGRVAWGPFLIEEAVPFSDRTQRKGQKAKQGILKDFAALTDGTDEDVFAFIGQWGVLGINAVIKEKLLIPERPNETFYIYEEQTDTYRNWARRVRAVLNLARALQQGNAGDIEDLAVWCEHESEERAEGSRYGVIQRLSAECPESDLSLHPEFKDAALDVASARQKDQERWQTLTQEWDLTACAKWIDLIINGWIATRTFYFLGIKGSLGQARPSAGMGLAEATYWRFWHNELAGYSVLVPLGQALLHSLQFPIASCKECGRPVPNPSADVRKGFGQFCGSRCRVKDHRARNRENYRKKKAAQKAGG